MISICFTLSSREKKMKKMLIAPLLLLPMIASAQPVTKATVKMPGDKVETPKKNVYIRYFEYDDHVYSQAKKTEAGDVSEIDLRARYEFNANTFFDLRFETRPEENSEDNKTSKFEILLGHKAGDFNFSVDFDLKTDDGSTGGTSFGPDSDSEGTFISWSMSKAVSLSFFPYNFDGEVGTEFDTWDVTRIYHIEGAPSTINNTQLSDETITSKTIPGIVLTWKSDLSEKSNVKAWAGIGQATYLYPGNSSFDIENNPGASRWERREDTGYKLGFEFKSNAGSGGKIFKAEYVYHDESKETGALLSSAGSVYGLSFLGNFMFEGEVTYSKAGSAPWNVNRAGEWFDQQTPFQPVYKDNYGNRQDWIDEGDFAYGVKLGVRTTDQVLPYVSFKYQGKHFIFRDAESAHRLRTSDDAASHGGLARLGIGAFINKGNFMIRPELEWRRANNDVFGSSNDVRADRLLSTFKDTDSLLSVLLTYSFDGENRIR
jgi:hypothetical protein